MLQSRLLSAAAEMGIALSPVQGDQFAAYHEMLQTANRSFNLTRIPDDPAEAVDRNYLDCIAPIAHGWPVGARTAIDVGSGAGFPGIPLAIALPQVHFVLLDALDKRVKFLQSAVDALGLNAEAVHLRAEDAARRPEFREQFDIALARAVAPLNVLAEYLLPFVRTGGQMLALKGPDAENELTQAESGHRAARRRHRVHRTRLHPRARLVAPAGRRRKAVANPGKISPEGRNAREKTPDCGKTVLKN